MFFQNPFGPPDSAAAGGSGGDLLLRVAAGRSVDAPSQLAVSAADGRFPA